MQVSGLKISWWHRYKVKQFESKFVGCLMNRVSGNKVSGIVDTISMIVGVLMVYLVV